MLLRTVIGSLVFTFASAADWTVEILSCDESPYCEIGVNYVPGETFGASVTEPYYPDSINRYGLVLDVTNTTTLKLVSAGSCPCPGRHISPELNYFWVAEDCFFGGENCVYEEIIEVTPGSYFIELLYAGFFSISNAEPTPEPVAGDFDGDGDADVDDYNALGNSLGLCASDTNRDSIVDFSDLLMVINDWGTTCDTNP